MQLQSCLASVAVMVCACSLAAAQTSGFTYQGLLRGAETPAQGVFDISVTPFREATGGDPLAAAACFDNITVADGTFTLSLPFSVPVDGSQMFLQFAVRSDTGQTCANTSGFTTLSPRQAVTPAPISLYTVAIRESALPIRGAMRLRGRKLQIFDGQFWRNAAELSQTDAEFDQSVTWSTPGTHSFVVPPNVTTIVVRVNGASGGGGGTGPGTTTLGSTCSSATNFALGGGGGGSGSRGYFDLVVTPGETLTVIVGAGGAFAPTGVGGAGGASIVRRGEMNMIVAPGGTGGRRPLLTGVMGVNPLTPNCGSASNRTAGALGGAGGSVPTLLAAGQIRNVYAGNDGWTGAGPACISDQLGQTTVCSGFGGAGGSGAGPNGSPVVGIPSLPRSQGGWGGWGSPGTPGDNGSVSFFWN